LIIAYKLVETPISLGFALWLTLSPARAYQAIGKLARELADGGPIWARVAHAATSQLSIKFLTVAAIISWLAGLSAAVEAYLLWRGGLWGEWVVTIGLACLLPFELFALIRHPSAVKAVVLTINTLVVLYLVRERLADTSSARRAREA
jgi:uncharacterized membrane protein (DUF2068 family)